MKGIKRLSLEIILWAVIGLIIWTNQGNSAHILKEHVLVLAFQTILIALLIFYSAPKLLLKRKHLSFILVSLSAIALAAWLISLTIPFYIQPPQPLQPNINFIDNPLPPPTHLVLHILLLSITYLVATAVEVFIFLKDKEKESITHKNINLQNELKLLKSQINPHFLFNALNNIYALSALDTERTQQSISYLSDMLRYVIYDCEQNFVPLEKEIAYIENYLKLFALKSSKPYPITLDFQIKNHQAKIAPMLLIPFVENALKHGNIENRSSSFISISIQDNTDFICFEIENSIPKTPINKDTVGGIGLENVKKRLKLLYPDQHDLTIKQSDTTFFVTLKLRYK